MKRSALILLAFVCFLAIIVGVFRAINITKNHTERSLNDGRIKVVATIFPIYDWALNITKGCESDIDLKLVLKTPVDMHNFQPTADDVIDIKSSDLLLYVGGESEEWVRDCLVGAKKSTKAISILDILGTRAKAEELVEGMQHEEDEDGHHHHHDSYEDHDSHEDIEEIEYDEHVWLSARNAIFAVQKIADSLSLIDAKNADVYKKNAEHYISLLKILDEDYKKVVGSAQNPTLLFADRFPFRYLADDYNIRYFAAFSGCSTESDASFETIMFLSKKLDELRLKSIITLENTEPKIAKSVIENTISKDANILVLNSMQSFLEERYKNGEEDDYIAIMYSNLEVIKKALGLN